MMHRFLNRKKQDSVLYHAVSSYQLLAALLHRITYHPTCRAVLILPDFITRKYPNYKSLTEFFNAVYLFPYLHIPHGSEHQVLADVERCCRERIPDRIDRFGRIYVAGAHFYFSLYLIRHAIPFAMIEDAAGLISRPNDLYRPLLKNFPLHAQIAQKYGLFDGSNECIEQILCLKAAQTIDVSGPKYVDFCPEDLLAGMTEAKRERVIHFFIREAIPTDAQAVLLTQHFAGLGIMTQQEQEELYRSLAVHALRGIRLIVKPHPDDTLDYTGIFPGAQIIRTVFPSELLPYVLHPKPEYLYAFDSAGCENLAKHFIIKRIGRDQQHD